MPPPSKSLSILLEVVGPADAVRMVQALGGTRWSVPATGRLPEGHLWIEVIGPEQAAKLARYVAGEPDVRIPRDMGIIDALIYEQKQAGKTHNELARQFQKDVRNIIRAIQRHQQARLADAQRGLFDDPASY